LRVFGDKLITEEDKKVVADKLTELVQKNFPNEAPSALVSPIVFGDYKSLEEEIRIYEDYNTYDQLRPYFEDMLLNYNEKHTPMNLVLFDDALEHLSRLLRVIRRPRGHALLVGLTGSGKSSLARLAAFVSRYQIFEITLARGYGDNEFKEDIKKLFRMLGNDGKEAVFLFTESHLAKESFMEALNNMLTAGIVPTLFGDDERDQIINSIRDEVVKASIVDTTENCWNYFVNKCRDNLHIGNE
jgi:dynein heavy chain